ncbi:MAG: DUF58 domain-containing protein, partial [Planctomycetota bacterium]
MIPTPRLIIVVSVLLIPLFIGSFERSVADLALIGNLIIGLIAAVDFLISPSPSRIELEREINEVLSVGSANPASLRLKNTSGSRISVSVHDDPGEMCETNKLPQTVLLEPWKEKTISYSIKPLNRGPSNLKGVFLRFKSRLGLWIRHEFRELPQAIRVYPDIRSVYQYELLARENRLAEIGVRIRNMPGQGREFERLREYRYGDELRQIDWKATSRQRQLISREFNVERNQNLVLMVDCGRFMRAETDGISYLDRALNAATMLSYIALGQGDNVSILAFSNKIERFIRPIRGKPGIQSILRSTYDIQASDQIADYSLAMEYLMKVQRRRALVILITFITDEVQLDAIGENLKLRSLPYLPMVVLLEDVGLRKMADRIPGTDLQAHYNSAAAQLLTGQSLKVASLRDSGILMIDTPPDLLTEKLINQYLGIKYRN